MNIGTLSALALLGLLFLLQPAHAAQQTVLGSKFSLKDPQPAGAASKRQWSVQAKALSSTATVAGDPTTGGATVYLLTDGTVPGAQSWSLPQGVSSKGKPLWKATSNGFVYSDPEGINGPLKSVKITRSGRGTFSLMAKASAAHGSIDVLPPNAGMRACVRLDLGGGDNYHVLFDAGATIGKNDAKQFQASKATSEGLCCGVGSFPACCPASCPVLDACDLGGSCDPLVGACPTKPDGATCDAGLTSGYTKTCTGGDCGECPAGGFCSCTSDSQCPSGETCSGGVCSTSQKDCRFDEECDLGVVRGTCETPPTLSPRYLDNADGTVTDRRTCLVWEKKDAFDGTPVACPDSASCANPHDADNVYTWDDGAGVRNGTAFTVFLAQLNGSAFAGRSDWRLPSTILAGLVDDTAPGCGMGQPCIASAFDADCTPTCSGSDPTCSCTRPFDYWLGSDSAFVDFADGGTGTATPDSSLSVRAVRGCYPVQDVVSPSIKTTCTNACFQGCGNDGSCILGCDFALENSVDSCNLLCNQILGNCLGSCLRTLDCIVRRSEGTCAP